MSAADPCAIPQAPKMEYDARPFPLDVEATPMKSTLPTLALLISLAAPASWAEPNWPAPPGLQPADTAFWEMVEPLTPAQSKPLLAIYTAGEAAGHMPYCTLNGLRGLPDPVGPEDFRKLQKAVGGLLRSREDFESLNRQAERLYRDHQGVEAGISTLGIPKEMTATGVGSTWHFEQEYRIGDNLLGIGRTSMAAVSTEGRRPMLAYCHAMAPADAPDTLTTEFESLMHWMDLFPKFDANVEAPLMETSDEWWRSLLLEGVAEAGADGDSAHMNEAAEALGDEE